MDGNGAAAIGTEKLRHEVGMALGTAEAKCTPAPVGGELFKGVAGARLRRQGIGQGDLVEVAAAPRDVGVFDLIRDAEVVEWA